MCNFLFSKILWAGSFLISSLGMLPGPGILYAQPVPEFKLLYRVEQPLRFLTVDQLGQIYVVTPSSELLQFNTQGKVVYTYQNFRHGNLAWVDASNPLNILLFYPEFGQVIILDRTLSEVALLNLPELGLWDVPAVGRAGDNQIWLYDPVQMLIRKISAKGEFLVEGQPLSLLLPILPNPKWIVERKQEVFLFDPQLGVLVFDVFGQYLNTTPTQGMEHLHIGEKFWNYRKEGTFYSYSMASQLTYPISVPEEAKTGIWQGNRNPLVLQTEKGFSVYVIE